MMAAAPREPKRRQSVLEHALNNEGVVEFHPIREKP
jgi:hypothetical protein